MSSLEAPRCRHIKVSCIQCGSPALRKNNFCFYHQQNRPWKVECYELGDYSTGEITLPYFEDAHSIQAVLRDVVQMVMQKRLEKQTAGILLYALQIASSNLKRVALEKPQPEQVVVDVVSAEKCQGLVAAPVEDETARETSQTNSPAISEQMSEKSPEQISEQCPAKSPDESERSGEELLPGSIQACAEPQTHQSRSRKRQYVI
jgi:hypothetical protein